jgi:hypothetical protein
MTCEDLWTRAYDTASAVLQRLPRTLPPNRVSAAPPVLEAPTMTNLSALNDLAALTLGSLKCAIEVVCPQGVQIVPR